MLLSLSSVFLYLVCMVASWRRNKIKAKKKWKEQCHTTGIASDVVWRWLIFQSGFWSVSGGGVWTREEASEDGHVYCHVERLRVHPMAQWPEAILEAKDWTLSSIDVVWIPHTVAVLQQRSGRTRANQILWRGPESTQTTLPPFSMVWCQSS